MDVFNPIKTEINLYIIQCLKRASPRLIALIFSMTTALITHQASAQNAAACAEPNVLLILDHSGSMNDNNKWNQAVEAINQVTFGFDTFLRFGLIYFPSRSNCGVDLGSGLLNDVLPANGGNIRNSLMNLRRPDGGTPLADSIRTGAQYYNQFNDQTRKNVIVVITDGMESCENQNRPVQRASEAQQQGYLVYVIGFGNGVDPNALSQIAQAGGTGNYFQANNTDQLFDALRTIADQARAEECDGADNDCDGLIDEEIPPQPCDIGCGLGEIICLDGIFSTCMGGEIPSEECDGMDNDCDGVVDEVEAVPCETESQQPGTAECLGNGMVSEDCIPNDPNREEICDGVDNDLDGEIDENTTQLCNYECHEGRILCIEGELRGCSAAPVSEERCNGEDDDCDELIDEMVSCPGQDICGEEGQCLALCQSGECQANFICGEDGYCHPLPCEPACGERERCLNRECIIPCLADEQCDYPREICNDDEKRCIQVLGGTGDPLDMMSPMGGSSGSGGGPVAGVFAGPNMQGGTTPPVQGVTSTPAEPDSMDPIESGSACTGAPTKSTHALWLLLGALFIISRRLWILNRAHTPYSPIK